MAIDEGLFRSEKKTTTAAVSFSGLCYSPGSPSGSDVSESDVPATSSSQVFRPVARTAAIVTRESPPSQTEWCEPSTLLTLSLLEWSRRCSSCQPMNRPLAEIKNGDERKTAAEDTMVAYSTQLPLPQGFLGSGADFPIGNVSFFLFFSGYVTGKV
ncbi:MYB domain class transcription factor [Pyrus ussuriensis x Pyrus communis]|uniref:MYB domain class transcription factor n=1 Tax=Pyrus ussuriensis x Pyrus communis TaxID=2448454 RepID=A0A5N5FGF3_9ROSA|nr:MYB domain class transcription factor [Pyrus ussuriensis x Pyrus communis]